MRFKSLWTAPADWIPSNLSLGNCQCLHRSSLFSHIDMQSIPLPVWKLGVAFAAVGGVGASFYVWKDALKEDALLSKHERKYALRGLSDLSRL